MAPDAVSSQEQRQERLSVAYVSAVAASAGYATSKPDPDMDGIDLRVSATGDMHPSIDVQLKATTSLNRRSDGSLSYALPVRNYELLREPVQTPRLLVLLDLHDDQTEWLTITHEQLALKRCAYWVDLTNHPGTTNTTSVTVDVPRSNLLNVEGLVGRMDWSRQLAKRRTR